MDISRPCVIEEVFPVRIAARTPRTLEEFLRQVVDVHGIGAGCRSTTRSRWRDAIHRIRPELDIYVTDRPSGGGTRCARNAGHIRRIFYGLEEVMELHLSILAGVEQRYDTPFFSNLKAYAKRPVGTFHALPVARGKSVFGSHWIRDMGHFYGTNLFPRGIIGDDRRSRQPARAYRQYQKGAGTGGAVLRRRPNLFCYERHLDREQDRGAGAVCQPGDIVLVDRNCHKSHHYGMVLCGAQPLLPRRVPAPAVLDVRRRTR